MEGSLSTKPTWEEVFTSDTRPVPFSPFLYKQKEDMGAGQFSNSLLLSFTFTLGDNFVFIGDRGNWGLTSFVKFPTSGFPISKFPSISISLATSPDFWGSILASRIRNSR